MHFIVPLALSIGFSALSNAATMGSRGDLLSFENVRSLNNADRVRLYDLASKESRDAFWVDKLESYREERNGTLNQDQTAALDDAILFIKSEDGPAPPELEKSMIEAFDSQEVNELMASLGGDKEQSLEKRRNRCSCRVGTGACGLGDYCHFGGWNCQPGWCGIFFREECNGDCGLEIQEP